MAAQSQWKAGELSTENLRSIISVEALAQHPADGTPSWRAPLVLLWERPMSTKIPKLIFFFPAGELPSFALTLNDLPSGKYPPPVRGVV